MNIRFIGILAALVLVAIFAVQNSASTSISFFMYELNVSKALIIIVAVAIGALIGLMVSVLKAMKKNRVIKDTTRDYNLAQGKIRELEEDKQRLEAANAKLKEDLKQVEISMEKKIKEDAAVTTDKDARNENAAGKATQEEEESKVSLKDKWNKFMNI